MVKAKWERAMNTEPSKRNEVACAKVLRLARRQKELRGQGESSLENRSSGDYRECDWTVESLLDPNIWPHILC